MKIHARFHTLAVAFLLCALGTELHAEQNTDEQKLAEVKASIAALKAELEATKSNRDKLLQNLEKSEKEIGEISKKANTIKGELDETKEKLEQLRDERSQLQKNKSSQQSLVGQHINTAYRLGHQSNLKLLLNQQDPSAVARNLKYHDYIIRARSQQIDAYTQTIKRINTLEPEIAYQTQKLSLNHAKLKQQQNQLLAVQKTRKSTLGRLESSINSQDQKLKSLHADRSRLEKILNQVATWIDNIEVPQSEKFRTQKGKLPWPTDGKVIESFGASRVSNKLSWQGILIRSTTGSPVIAVHHGRVVFSDYLRGHGLLLIIDHGDDYMTLYAHNQALYKELGEWVDEGDVIASVGNSGGQHQAALYFELRHQGKPTNPKKWLKRA